MIYFDSEGGTACEKVLELVREDSAQLLWVRRLPALQDSVVFMCLLYSPTKRHNRTQTEECKLYLYKQEIEIYKQAFPVSSLKTMHVDFIPCFEEDLRK